MAARPRASRRQWQARAVADIRRIAAESAAIRRVALLVARAASPEEVFASIAAEAGQLLGADFTAMARCDPGGGATFLAQWVRTGAAVPVPLGTRFRHARASAVKVEVAARDRVVHLRVSDDGRGGADFGRGSGLVGLKDRVEALGGRILLDSPPGSGTVLDVVLPLDGPNGSADREYRPHDHSGHSGGSEPHPG
jgi:GAF domain-containing protein